MEPLTFGIEEEFFLADANTGDLREDSPQILDRARELADEGIDKELRAAMVETGSAVCLDAAAASKDLTAHRRAILTAAGEVGGIVLATSTHPSARAVTASYSADERYKRMARTFGRLAHEALVCGCHIHVAVPDREAGVRVIDRIRPWLSPLIALSANSPIWQDSDTGFDSWRSQVWSRWPTAGPTAEFGDLDSYERRADALIVAGAAIDRAMLYYDVRLSEKYPTVEIRVADVCLEVGDAVLLAVLARALVSAALNASGVTRAVDVGLLRAANFLAARGGVHDQLLSPTDWRPQPAAAVVHQLLDVVEPELAASGDLELAREGVATVLRRGTGATRQRAAWQEGGAAAVLRAVTVS